jgi:trigger factor
VSRAKLPDLDETFFQGFGVREGGEAAFRQEVKATMQRELDQTVKERVKMQIMDALLAANPIQLPKALIGEEVTRIKEQTENFNPPPRGGEAWDKALEERAARRVALGLLLSEIIKKNQYKASPDKVRAAVDAIAVTYEHPEEVVKWYYARRERLVNVEALVLEDQAADWLIQQAEVHEKALSYDELITTRRSNA